MIFWLALGREGATATLLTRSGDSYDGRSSMIHLDLKETEAAALVKVLDYYVSELRMEVAGTEQKDVRDALKSEEDALKSVLQALKTRLGQN